MSISVSMGPKTAKMKSFLLLFATILLLIKASSSKRFLSVPTFHDSLTNKPDGRRRAFLVTSALQQYQQTDVISVRGGASDEEKDEDDDDDSESESGSENKVEDGEEMGEDEEDDETDNDSSDADDYYDDETDDEDEEEDELASELEKKSSKAKKSSESFVEPYFVSPSLQMYTTFGTILLSRKIDMFHPGVVRLIRTLFIVYLLVQQAFIFYVRILAKGDNDRTPVQIQNPLTSMLSSQLEKQQGGANDMVKNLASSFLKTDSTVMEYDMGQAQKLQGGMLFNIVLMWFLHFKLQQVQPLLVTSINGFLQLFYNPLFQVYVLGRNLERPFKSPEVFKDPKAEEESTTTETASSDEATDKVTGDDDNDNVEKDEEENQDESSDDEEESSSDETDSEDDSDDDDDDDDDTE